ncbi:hypothetical protein QUB47_19535 [Microcoleus sp. AT9_B5]
MSPPNPNLSTRRKAHCQHCLRHRPQGLMVLFDTRSRCETERSPDRYRPAASELLAVGRGGRRR